MDVTLKDGMRYGALRREASVLSSMNSEHASGQACLQVAASMPLLLTDSVR